MGISLAGHAFSGTLCRRTEVSLTPNRMSVFLLGDSRSSFAQRSDFSSSWQVRIETCATKIFDPPMNAASCEGDGPMAELADDSRVAPTVAASALSLATVSGGEQSYSHCELRGNIDYVHTIIAQAMRQWRSQAGGTLFLRSGCSTILGESVQLSVNVFADRHGMVADNCSEASTAAAVYNALLRINGDDHLTSGMLEYLHHHSPQDWIPFDSGGHTNFGKCNGDGCGRLSLICAEERP